MTKRYRLIDFIRGLAVINMIAYHALWDVVHIFGKSIAFLDSQGGYMWQQCICWCFIFISGFSMNLGKRSYKRGVEVFLGGVVITAATVVAMPQNRVVFGVLTFLGSAMLITVALFPLIEKINPAIGFTVSILLFALTRNINNGNLGFEVLEICEIPATLYSGYVSTFFGFTAPGFYSSDYFSLFPWVFLFWAGCFSFRILAQQKRLSGAEKSICPAVELIGRKSFPIYLAHQPVIYLVLTVIYSMVK